MKVQFSMLVPFLFALCISAQDRSDPSRGPEVTVIQKKWRIEVRNPALDRDPVKENSDREQAERRRKEDELLNEKLREQGMPTRPASAPVLNTPPGGIAITYIYEVKVRNTGERTIRALTWDYVFFEPGTGREVGRRRFVSEIRIGPGKTKNVVMRSVASPTGGVDATKAGQKQRDQYSEQIVIQRVAYADGSVWEAPSN